MEVQQHISTGSAYLQSTVHARPLQCVLSDRQTLPLRRGQTMGSCLWCLQQISDPLQIDLDHAGMHLKLQMGWCCLDALEDGLKSALHDATIFTITLAFHCPGFARTCLAVADHSSAVACDKPTKLAAACLVKAALLTAFRAKGGIKLEAVHRLIIVTFIRSKLDT